MVEISIDGRPPAAGIIDVHQEWIDVGTLSAQKPDPDWTYLDERGHFHAWDDEGNLPTLDRRMRHIDPVATDEIDDDPDPDDLDDDNYDDDDRDGYEESFYACRICGEEIEPKYVPASRDRKMPGLKSWTIEVDQALTCGTQVSVVATTTGSTAFGVGVVTAVSHPRPGTVRSTIAGSGDLGIRTRSVEAT